MQAEPPYSCRVMLWNRTIVVILICIHFSFHVHDILIIFYVKIDIAPVLFCNQENSFRCEAMNI